jgi:hypothetical protein
LGLFRERGGGRGGQNSRVKIYIHVLISLSHDGHPDVLRCEAVQEGVDQLGPPLRQDVAAGQHLLHAYRFYHVKAVLLGIRVSMYLGLPDPNPLVRGTDPDPDPSHFLINVLRGLK